MKSSEIKKIIAQDPDATFARKPTEQAVHSQELTLIQGLSPTGLPGLWKYEKVRHPNARDWKVLEPDVSHHDPERHMSVLSREIIPCEEAEALLRERAGEAEAAVADREGKQQLVNRISELRVDAQVLRGDLVIIDWEAFNELLANLERRGNSS